MRPRLKARSRPQSNGRQQTTAQKATLVRKNQGGKPRRRVAKNAEKLRPLSQEGGGSREQLYARFSINPPGMDFDPAQLCGCLCATETSVDRDAGEAET